MTMANTSSAGAIWSTLCNHTRSCCTVHGVDKTVAVTLIPDMTHIIHDPSALTLLPRRAATQHIRPTRFAAQLRDDTTTPGRAMHLFTMPTQTLRARARLILPLRAVMPTRRTLNPFSHYARTSC